MKSHMRKIFVLGRLLLVLALLLQVSGVAFAQVWTDKPDYMPGSVVTISGNGDAMQNGQPSYVGGQPVHVAVTGPNGWTSSCDATVGSGAWSCQVTLSTDPAVAVGPYTYTATSSTLDGAPIVETGTFTDGNADLTGYVYDSGGNPVAGATVTCIAGCTNTGQQNPDPTGPTGAFSLQVEFQGGANTCVDVTIQASQGQTIYWTQTVNVCQGGTYPVKVALDDRGDI